MLGKPHTSFHYTTMDSPWHVLILICNHSLCTKKVLAAGHHIVAGQMWKQLQTVEWCFWAREIRSDCWEQISMATWDNEQWCPNFCISKGTAIEIYAEQVSYTQWQTTEMRVPLSMGKHMNEGSLQAVANHFNVGKIPLERLFGRGVTDDSTGGGSYASLELMHRKSWTGLLAWGSTALVPSRAHTSQSPPLCTVAGNSISKGFLIVLQAVVDHHGHFMHVNASWLGKVLKYIGIPSSLSCWSRGSLSL